VLAHEETSNFACNASQGFFRSVHKLPLAGDGLRVYRNGLHVNPLVNGIPGQGCPGKSDTNIDGFSKADKGKKSYFSRKVRKIRVSNSINCMN
jgi:hypothetical protein